MSIDNKVQFVIVSWLDAERILGVSQKKFAIRNRTADWVERRCRIFKNFTLQSLLNQDDDNFRLWLYCGLTHRNITSSFDFGEKVELCYDYGKKFISELEHPWFSLTRIDSDDCFHKTVMQEIKSKTIANDNHTTMGYRDLIQWNVLHNFISDIRIIVSPFTTHCWPRHLYQNLLLVNRLQFSSYRNPQIRLSPGKVCIIRHKDNVTWKRINKKPGSRQYFLQEKAKRNNFITDREKIVRILRDFGIRPEQVPNKRSH